MASRSTELTPRESIEKWDVIVFTVSIRNTPKVIRKLVPDIPKDKLIMDFTGIKSQASKELKKYTKWEVVATHPMFGPWVEWLKDQNIIYDPISPGAKWEQIYAIWENDWARLIEMDSEKHDEIAAIIQSTVHLMNLIIWNVLVETWVSLEEVEKMATPVYRMQFSILSRFVSQEADLYADMQMENQVYQDEIIPIIQDHLEEMQDVLESKDSNSFQNHFNNIKEYVWQDFIDKSMDITNKIDDILKN